MIKEAHEKTADLTPLIAISDGNQRLADEVPNGIVSSMWNDEERILGKGRRHEVLHALSLMSGFPLLLASDNLSEGDSGGTLIFVLCCVAVFYLFSFTGWRNEEIKK